MEMYFYFKNAFQVKHYFHKLGIYLFYLQLNRLEEVKAINADGIEYVKTGIKGELGLLENLKNVQQMRGLISEEVG